MIPSVPVALTRATRARNRSAMLLPRPGHAYRLQRRIVGCPID